MSTSSFKGESRSVFIALVGRPNVGKSSLLNRFIGLKAAIVSPKPQTTRTRITGILTKHELQYVFLDTPGFHKAHNKLGEQMLGTVRNSLLDTDVVLMLFEPKAPLRETEHELLSSIKNNGIPALAAVNKVDTLSSLQDVQARVSQLQNMNIFREVYAVSAQTGEGCEDLLSAFETFAQAGPHFFPDDAYTDQPERVLLAEIVREKLLLHMHEEIPHGIFVQVERFKERKNAPILDIDITIFCERKSHKGMIIGKGGQMLKTVAAEARIEAEQMLNTKINLQCWVKVRDDWRDDANFLNRSGFSE